MDADPGALPPINHPVNDPEVSKVPDASGRVHVLAAVKSAEVIVPIFGEPVTMDWGLIAIWSEPLVDEPKTAEPLVPNIVDKLVEGAVFILIPPVPAFMVVELEPFTFPIVTSPEEVPVLILVGKLEPSFKLITPPVEVNPD